MDASRAPVRRTVGRRNTIPATKEQPTLSAQLGGKPIAWVQEFVVENTTTGWLCAALRIPSVKM